MAASGCRDAGLGGANPQHLVLGDSFQLGFSSSTEFVTKSEKRQLMIVLLIGLF
jgi:hypothetical protein